MEKDNTMVSSVVVVAVPLQKTTVTSTTAHARSRRCQRQSPKLGLSNYRTTHYFTYLLRAGFFTLAIPFRPVLDRKLKVYIAGSNYFQSVSFKNKMTYKNQHTLIVILLYSIDPLLCRLDLIVYLPVYSAPSVLVAGPRHHLKLCNNHPLLQSGARGDTWAPLLIILPNLSLSERPDNRDSHRHTQVAPFHGKQCFETLVII